MQTLWQEIRYSVRRFFKQPGFTVVVVLTLGLAIGANTAIFSVVNALLLRALPYDKPENLVAVGKPANSGGLPGLAAYEYLAWRENSKTLADIAAHSNNNFNLIGEGEPERISCAKVTASLFTTLGVQPLKGRAFVSEEDQPGNNNVAVVSESFWVRRYGRDESILGRSITLNDKSYIVIGVMPASFRFPGEYEIWLPLALDRQKETQGDIFSLIQVVGRLKSGATAQQAQTELSYISRQASEQGKEKLPVSTVEVLPLQHQLVAGLRSTLLVLWGAVGLVMLLACSNVANLLLSRTLTRQREFAVRAAVGARRWQLLRQLLTESLLLGLIGGVVGLLIAIWTSGALANLVPKDLVESAHQLNGVKIDWQVFTFTIALSVLTGIVFGLVPAVSGSKPDLVKSLKESRSGLGHFGLRRLRGGLVTIQIALAVVLLLAAGLLVRSFNRLTAVNPGFDPHNVLTVRIDLPRSSYTTESRTISFHHQLIEKVRSLPGVESVGAINHKPLGGSGMIAFIDVEGNPKLDRKKDKPIIVGAMTPDYFKTLRIPLLKGRDHDERDGPESAAVAIVNEAFVRRFFSGADPIGKKVSFGCEEGLCRTIVGVVGNAKQETLTDDVIPELYVPFPQVPVNGMTLLVRTNGDPAALAGAVRKEVFAIDKNQPVYDVKTLDERIAETMSVSRALMFLFGSFAVLALVLASVGVYGVISYAVNQRTHEIGIRIALGARTADVLKLTIKNGIVLTLIGIAIGVGSALMLTRFMEAMLFGVTPTDKLTFVGVSSTLFLVALCASLIPARRATKVDPLVALRYE